MNLKLYTGEQLPQAGRSFILEGNRAFNWTRHVSEADFKQPFSLYFVLEADGEIYAYVATHHLFERLEINGVYVTPTRRRQGYGRLVMEGVLAYAHESSIEQVLLEVRASNEAAFALYEGLNFELISRRKGYYHQPYEDALIMLYDVERNRKDDLYLSD